MDLKIAKPPVDGGNKGVLFSSWIYKMNISEISRFTNGDE
jgi:hypothetical protein